MVNSKIERISAQIIVKFKKLLMERFEILEGVMGDNDMWQARVTVEKMNWSESS